MSLKWFHIVFISLSMMLSLWFGVWGLFNQQIVLGVVSLGALGRPGACTATISSDKLRKLGV